MVSHSFSNLELALKKAVSQNLSVTLSSLLIASIEVETKSKIFNVKFRASKKREFASQSEACMLANQKNVKVSHCLVEQLDMILSPI